MGTRFRIDADLLIPGAGEPITNGTLVIDDARIAFAGPTTEAPTEKASAPGAGSRSGSTPEARSGPQSEVSTTVHVPVVMPGMWDSHAHFMGLSRLDLATFATTTTVQAVARATIDLGTVLDSGFTSVRELGGFGLRIAPAIDDGTVPGPHIYGAGAVLSPTGGHADIHALPLAAVALIPPPEPILHTRTVAEPPAVCNEHDGLVECPAGVTWPPDMPPYEVSGDRTATPRARYQLRSLTGPRIEEQRKTRKLPE